MTPDEISLTLPATKEFHRVAHLVMGGLAVRLDLSFESLEDLELALDALLRRSNGEDVTVRVRVLNGELQTEIGPFTSSVREELERGGDDDLNLSRILRTVCDAVEIEERDGEEWVELTKRVDTTGGG